MVRKTGRWVGYFPSQKKASEGEYINGMKEGYGLIFMKTVRKQCDGSFKKRPTSRKNGCVITRAAKKQIEGTYSLGQKDGIWIEYDEDGNKTSEIRYKNGAEAPSK